MMEWRRDLYRTQGRTDPAALNKLRAVVAQVIAAESLDSPNRSDRKGK
jgi:hypothetical protein